MHSKALHRSREIISPYLIREGGMGRDATCISDKALDDTSFDGGETYLLAIVQKLPCRGIKAHRPKRGTLAWPPLGDPSEASCVSLVTYRQGCNPL